MLKRRSKSIAILTVFIFCLTFLGAALVAPPVAEAAFTATVAQSNYVSAAAAQDLGYIKVEVNVADWTSVGGDQLLVSYPTRIGNSTNTTNVLTGATGPGNAGIVGSSTSFALSAASVAANEAALEALAPLVPLGGLGDSGIRVVIPNDVDNALCPAAVPATGPEIAVVPNPFVAGGSAATPNDAGVGLARNGAFTLILDPAGDGIANGTKDKGWFYIYFNRMDCSNYAGDVQISLVPQSGTAFGTQPTQVVVGKVQTSKSTSTVAKSVEKIPSSGGQIDTITIFENMPFTICETGVPQNISFKLVTKGYEWNTGAAAATGLFAFAGGAATFGGFGGTGTDTITLPVTAVPGGATTGAIAVTRLGITVDEKVAKVGQDIEVKVSGAGVTEQTIVVGQYVDFIATVIEDTTTELTAGLDDQKIGTFFIEEVAPGTLIEDRTILFELPAGVEWNTGAIAQSNYELANNSAINFNAGGLLDARTLKFTVNTGSQNAQNGAKVKFKSLKVDVSPSFTGDVVMTVKGKAGVEGTAKVATVNPMITMTASAPEVNLGIKEQKASDVEVVETKADTIVARNAGFDQDMAFYLDQGFRFAKVPKVEVIEGDMVLEVNDVKIQAPANGQNLLIVPIRAASYKTPAKIKISDIYVTADRNAPVGDVILYAADTNSYPQAPGLCNAFNSTGRLSFQYDTPASVAIAKNVTVPPVETKGTTGGGSGTFVIGSNIYTVNGLTKIMDVAPYIKNGRTFVPYRYLALALGVADDGIVWDDSSKKVTVTKGDIVVEATIGSTTLTVNGESVTMDVAPEISNGRTMLPARYLAEALGGNVGWDQTTKTVVFEM